MSGPLEALDNWVHARRARTADRRIAERNAQEAVDPKCPCGDPGTVCRRLPWGYIGQVAPEFWYCEAHEEVPLTTWWGYPPGSDRGHIVGSPSVN